MLKKIIAAGAVLAFFACTSIDDLINETNQANEANNVANVIVPSSSSQGNITISSSSSLEQSSNSGNSSSSEEAGSSDSSIPIASLIADKKSVMFGTYAYVFTLKEGQEEDLTPYWNVDGGCSVEAQETKPADTCQLPTTGAILQHNLTNQYSPLHYQSKYARVNSSTRVNTLYQWNLTKEGDEATLGVNVYEGDSVVQSIGDLKITALDSIVAFEYKYAGSAHEFRIVSTDTDFWYYEVPSSAKPDITLTNEDEYQTVVIPIKDLKGMGSFDETTPFDISTTTKFLWAAKYKEGASTNKGSVAIYDLNAKK